MSQLGFEQPTLCMSGKSSNPLRFCPVKMNLCIPVLESNLRIDAVQKSETYNLEMAQYCAVKSVVKSKLNFDLKNSVSLYMTTKHQDSLKTSFYSVFHVF